MSDLPPDLSYVPAALEWHRQTTARPFMPDGIAGDPDAPIRVLQVELLQGGASTHIGPTLYLFTVYNSCMVAEDSASEQYTLQMLHFYMLTIWCVVKEQAREAAGRLPSEQLLRWLAIKQEHRNIRKYCRVV